MNIKEEILDNVSAELDDMLFQLFVDIPQMFDSNYQQYMPEIKELIFEQTAQYFELITKESEEEEE